MSDALSLLPPSTSTNTQSEKRLRFSPVRHIREDISAPVLCPVSSTTAASEMLETAELDGESCFPVSSSDSSTLVAVGRAPFPSSCQRRERSPSPKTSNLTHGNSVGLPWPVEDSSHSARSTSPLQALSCRARIGPLPMSNVGKILTSQRSPTKRRVHTPRYTKGVFSKITMSDELPPFSLGWSSPRKAETSENLSVLQENVEESSRKGAGNVLHDSSRSYYRSDLQVEDCGGSSGGDDDENDPENSDNTDTLQCSPRKSEPTSPLFNRVPIPRSSAMSSSVPQATFTSTTSCDSNQLSRSIGPAESGEVLWRVASSCGSDISPQGSPLRLVRAQKGSSCSSKGSSLGSFPPTVDEILNEIPKAEDRSCRSCESFAVDIRTLDIPANRSGSTYRIPNLRLNSQRKGRPPSQSVVEKPQQVVRSHSPRCSKKALRLLRLPSSSTTTSREESSSLTATNPFAAVVAGAGDQLSSPGSRTFADSEGYGGGLKKEREKEMKLLSPIEPQAMSLSFSSAGSFHGSLAEPLSHSFSNFDEDCMRRTVSFPSEGSLDSMFGSVRPRAIPSRKARPSTPRFRSELFARTSGTRGGSEIDLMQEDPETSGSSPTQHTSPSPRLQSLSADEKVAADESSPASSQSGSPRVRTLPRISTKGLSAIQSTILSKAEQEANL